MRFTIALAALFYLNTVSAQYGEVPVISFADLSPRLKLTNDTTYVVNFWATWCKPCVEELPYFDSLESAFPEKKLKVLLVSLDFRSKRETLLLPYIEKNKVKSEVVLLYEPDADKWIRKIDANWQGSLPATLIYRNDKRKFFEKQLTKSQLYSMVKNF